MTERSSAPRHGRWGLYAPFVIVLGLLAAWTVWWFILAHQVEGRLDIPFKPQHKRRQVRRNNEGQVCGDDQPRAKAQDQLAVLSRDDMKQARGEVSH